MNGRREGQAPKSGLAVIISVVVMKNEEPFFTGTFFFFFFLFFQNRDEKIASVLLQKTINFERP